MSATAILDYHSAMTDRNETAQAHYLEAMRLYGEGDNSGAVAVFEAALEHEPDWTEALHGLAMALMHSGELDRAVEVGLRIVELDPDDPFAHTSLSIFYQRRAAAAEQAGNADEARANIALAEEEGAQARMLSWQEELKTNPGAPPPMPPPTS